MVIVADSSALIALACGEALPLLERIFEAVRVPQAVFAECTATGKPSAGMLASYLQTRVVEVDLSHQLRAPSGLGLGEIQAMVLYRQLSASQLLVDDQRARRVALLNKISVIGSLGVLLRAKELGFLDALAPRIEAIRAAGIHYGESLVKEALRLAGEGQQG